MLGKIKVGKGNWWSYTCNGKVKTLRRHMKAVTFTMFHVLDVHQFYNHMKVLKFHTTSLKIRNCATENDF